MKVIYEGWSDLKVAPRLAVETDPNARWFGWLFAEVNGEWVSVADVNAAFASDRAGKQGD